MSDLDHPNIVKYFETYDDNKYLYLVMEFVEGEEMFEKITNESGNKFTEKEAAGYVKQLLMAVNYLHAQAIVHRDIKPENIMINKND